MTTTIGPEQQCEALAQGQQGVFHRAQAIGLGLTERMIDRRLASGRWRRVLPGVYCLKGATLSWRARLMAACLWAKGVPSHRSAGALWGFDGVDEGLVEISSVHQRRPQNGVVLHRVHPGEDLSLIRYKGFLVTDPTRTLIDLAGVVDVVTLQTAIDSSLRRRQSYPGLLLRRLDELVPEDVEASVCCVSSPWNEREGPSRRTLRSKWKQRGS